jgi:hypothetical protein
MSDCPADYPGGYQQREEQKPDEDLTDRNRRVSLPLSCHSRTLPAGTGARQHRNYSLSGGDDPARNLETLSAARALEPCRTSILERWSVRWERFELALEPLSPKAWSSFVG